MMKLLTYDEFRIGYVDYIVIKLGGVSNTSFIADDYDEQRGL